MKQLSLTQMPVQSAKHAKAQQKNARLDPTWLERAAKRHKLRDTLDAIARLKALQATGRERTTEDEKVLSRYFGMGIAAELFKEPCKPEWQNEADRLRDLLSDEEYAAVRHTITTAYYTPTQIIQFIYKVLERFGVKSGNFLELGCGAGWFIGSTPKGLKAKWTAVEIEPISAAIAQTLYPESLIINRALERTRLAFDHDVFVGNAPFNEVAPYDAQSSLRNLGGIHDYCLMRGIEALRAGGLGAVLTSIGTLQSKRSQAFREWAGKRVKLLAAIKLPLGALASSSHTEASSDLLIFQKLQEDEDGNAHEWSELVESPVLNEETGEYFPMNRWFQLHPEHLLGTLGRDKLYGSGRLALEAQGDLGIALAGVLDALPQQIFESTRSAHKVDQGDVSTIAVPLALQDKVKAFAYFYHDGKLWQYRDGQLHRVKLTNQSTQRKRLWWLIQIRDAAQEVLRVQWESDDDKLLAEAQKKLNRVYDEFTTTIKGMGWLHNEGNSRAFGQDPDYPLLLALEVWDPEYPELTRKADIFHRRTIRHVQTVEQVETATEALVQSYLERGDIDLEYMSGLYGKTTAEILVELQTGTQPLVFFDPTQQSWVAEEEYLSGNVRLKLSQAQTAAATSAKYLLNIKALQAVQPKVVEPGQIYARLGSPWIPSDVIAAFVRHLMQLPPEHKVAVSKNQHSAHWNVNCSDFSSLLNNSEYGTSRVSGINLISQALNQKIPIVYDHLDRDTTVKNHRETRKAMIKQDRIKELFKRWVWQDWERATTLAEIYNRDFNCFRKRRFNGTHLIGKLKGISEVWQERLANPKRAYQYDTVWRMVKDGNTLVQHPTGAGKTAIAVVAAQLMKQYQLCHKPCLVVLDHLVLQQAAEAVQIYPGLRVLPISTRDLKGAKQRQEFQSRIGTGEWDLIVCSQTAFKMLALLPETVEQFVSEAVSDTRDRFYSEDKHKKRGGIKNLEKAADRAEAKTREEVEGIKRDTVCFEQTGIDRLFVDESQKYLGLETGTQMTGVLGVTGSTSQKAMDLYHKSRYLAATYGEGKCLYLLTATPIQNTLGQFWVNLKYLCPETLEERGISAFDDAISVFAEAKSTVEITAAGTMELKTRLANWSNKPEMQSLWFQVADVVLEQDLDIEKPIPEYGIKEIPATPSQLKFFDSVAERARQCRGKRNKKGDDNIPVITTHVKRGVIDLRLLPRHVLQGFLTDEEIDDLPNEHTKLTQLIEDVHESWVEHQEARATQLIFCDIGTPNTDGRWSAYQWAKQQLIEKGVTEAEIAFSHDAKTDEAKAALYRQFREGTIRILFGSTEMLGAGTHFPDRLYEVHNLDCPLRPIDRWQRDGRQIRPGNRYKRVKNYSYVTTGKPYQNEQHKTIQGLSPDSYLYEVNLRKANFIKSGFYEESTDRTMEDIDEAALDFATLVATATGDPRFKEKVGLENTISGLLLEEQSYLGTQAMVKQRLHQVPLAILEAAQAAARCLSDQQRRQDTRADAFTITIEGNVYNKRVSASERLHALAATMAQARSHSRTDIGTFAGFTLSLEHIPMFDQTLLHLSGANAYFSVVRDTPKGTVQALEALLQEPEKRLEECYKTKTNLEAELARLKPLAGLPFEQAEALEQALKRQAELNQQLGVTEAFGEKEDEAEAAVTEAQTVTSAGNAPAAPTSPPT